MSSPRTVGDGGWPVSPRHLRRRCRLREGPGFATSILPTYVYTWAFNRLEYGMAGAVATLALVIIFVVAAMYALLFREKES